MIYRDLCGEKVSLLGFGAMRMPKTANGKLNMQEAVGLIRQAIDGGINYIDTSYVYHEGLSEEAVGLALKDGYRDRAFVASKSPQWAIDAEGDFLKFFEESRKKLGVECIDYYLYHAVNASAVQRFEKYNIYDKAMQLKRDGRIKYFGFSFHDSYRVFEDFLSSYEWDFTQILLNYVLTKFQAGLRGLELCRNKGIPVIIMEPLLGGKLGNKMPPEMSQLLLKENPERKVVEWAFRYLEQLPGINLILSGMSNPEQLEENLKIFGAMDSDKLTKRELDFLKNLGKIWTETMSITCSDCKYCQPCPAGVDIPANIAVLNLYNKPKYGGDASASYERLKKRQTHAGKCTACKKCEIVCPQALKISEHMTALAKRMN